VQNRVSQALPRLPEDVQRLGVTTVKSTPTITMVVHLTSPDDRYDMTYLRNYAVLNVKDRLARIKGVGEVQFGSGNYAMRVWLDPGKVAERGLTAPEIVKAIREQNVQVAAGVVGAPPNDRRTPLQLNVNAQGRLKDEAEFGRSSSRPPPTAASPACATWPASSWPPPNMACAPCSTTSPPWPSPSSRRRAPTPWTSRPRCARDHGRWKRTSRLR
jgi:multidrug efflux pump